MNEDEYNSGPLVVGKAVFEPRVRAYPFPFTDSDPYVWPLVIDRAIDADEINREYQTQRIVVDKRTHRIRYENETEHEVTVIIEPKSCETAVRCDGPCGEVSTERQSGSKCWTPLNANETCSGTYRETSD